MLLFRSIKEYFIRQSATLKELYLGHQAATIAVAGSAISVVYILYWLLVKWSLFLETPKKKKWRMPMEKISTIIHYSAQLLYCHLNDISFHLLIVFMRIVARAFALLHDVTTSNRHDT